MELFYFSEKLKKQCTNLEEARKLFGGNIQLSISLLSRINALTQTETLKDIVVQPHFHFHKLVNKKRKNLEGYFAIDVKSRTDSWRIILQPLDENENPFIPCNIDEIAGKVKIIVIKEVSQHYE